MMGSFCSPSPHSLLVQTDAGAGPLVWHAHVGLLRPLPNELVGCRVLQGPCLCRALEGARSGLQALSPH